MKRITLLALAFCSLFMCQNAMSQNNTTKKSVQTAQSFIKRFPNTDVIGGATHFSWQAGYLLLSMEKMWNLKGDSVYLQYIKRSVDQQVD